MDIRALSQVTGGYTSASAVSVPVDSRAVIGEIAAHTGLSNHERGSLIAAVAAADSARLPVVERSQVLKTIQQLGIYLRNTGNEGFPRWTMMSALRAYGMNLTEDAGAASVALKQAVQQAVSERPVSVDTAVAVARTVVVRPVEVSVEAIAETKNPPGGDSVVRVEKVV